MHLPQALFAFISAAAIVRASPAKLVIRQECQSSHTLCQPSDSTKTEIPAPGPELAGLYTDLLESVKDVKTSKRGLSPVNRLERRESPTICCAEGTACLNLKNFNVPMCYDHFTTNYILPDGSNGQIVSGDYSSPKGHANLIVGNYTADGKSGSIYGTSSPPNTATLPIPTQYTGTGVGSAIPITELGNLATYTVTIPGTTVDASTKAASTISPLVVSGSTVPTASTAAATTIPGTTVAARTTTFTSAGPATSTNGAPLPTHFVGAGAAGMVIAALVAL